MNDDEKKPVESKDEVDMPDENEHDDTKVEVKFGGKSKKDHTLSDTRDDNSTEDVKKVDTVEEESSVSDADEKKPADNSIFGEESKSDDFEDEVSDLDRELERVEGIESASIAKAAPALDDSAVSDEESDAIQAIDLETPAPDASATPNDAVLAAALRKQEQAQREGSKKNGSKLAAIVLAVLLLVAGVAAAYFYLDSMSTKEQLQQAQVERDAAQVQVTALQAAQDDQDEVPEDIALDDGYRVIDEIGVRFKMTNATQDLLFGYTVTSSDEAADAVAFSTKELASLAVGEGASVTYPCAFTGNVPKITRYSSDIVIGESTASKLGKQVGESYYVYTAPIGQCAQSNTAAQSARDTAVKAVYDSLEALPGDDASSEETPVSDTEATTRETSP